VAAVSKIKEIVEEINRKDDTIFEKKVPSEIYPTEARALEVKADSKHSTEFTDDAAKGDHVAAEQACSHHKNKKLKKSDPREDFNGFEDSGASPSIQSESSSITSGPSLQTILASCSCSSLFSTETSVVSSIIKARLIRQRRRASRQVNSTGPMILSHRTDYRMSIGSHASPRYSPITAACLSFTPLAHIPTAPLFEGTHNQI
jgi:hypothetical protein